MITKLRSSRRASSPSTPQPALGDSPAAPHPRPSSRLGWIVAGSLAVGVLAALVLVAVVPAQESNLTGAVLCGFAVGWAMLAAASVRFTASPQRWAAVPAVVLGLSGVLLVAFGSAA